MSSPASRRYAAALDHQVFAGNFSLRRADPHQDLELVHSWMNDPEVARFWKMPWPLHEIASYLHRQDTSLHSTPYLGFLNGVPMSYWEAYCADLDPLAQHYAAQEHDVGLHMLLGPAECRGRRLAAGLIRAVSTRLLSRDPRTRVVAEPDVENTRVIRILEGLGWRRAADLDLPNKRAALMILERDQTR
ncbi:GCN5 family acetyltransferase [Mycobacterium sp. 852002-51163_SCH5372311]|uniref:GNAT family N-acetyltransferase n=1 Tax=Mycobacterium sp. 852002-51163_SCH5372311 TaxID=1834097 RepID=UPI00080030E0|nr:GNAT family N-acetyltransferase [Mycobacterium sp. 852002-51163_SCH5372311]OBF81036.1 GCN5 family acetyltransferase [Mycobacterium sp. 852002-51163_SCH5372311]